MSNFLNNIPSAFFPILIVFCSVLTSLAYHLIFFKIISEIKQVQSDIKDSENSPVDIITILKLNLKNYQVLSSHIKLMIDGSFV